MNEGERYNWTGEYESSKEFLRRKTHRAGNGNGTLQL